MDYTKYIEEGLNGTDPLKLILKGSIELIDSNKIGVVSIVYASTNKNLAQKEIEKLLKNKKNDEYYMIYSVPLDTDLTKLNHYPSIAISKDDLT